MATKPNSNPADKTVYVGAYIPKDLAEKMRVLADRMDLTLSQVYRRLFVLGVPHLEESFKCDIDCARRSAGGRKGTKAA